MISNKLGINDENVSEAEMRLETSDGGTDQSERRFLWSKVTQWRRDFAKRLVQQDRILFTLLPGPKLIARIIELF